MPSKGYLTKFLNCQNIWKPLDCKLRKFRSCFTHGSAITRGVRSCQESRDSWAAVSNPVQHPARLGGWSAPAAWHLWNQILYQSKPPSTSHRDQLPTSATTTCATELSWGKGEPELWSPAPKQAGISHPKRGIHHRARRSELDRPWKPKGSCQRGGFPLLPYCFTPPSSAPSPMRPPALSSPMQRKSCSPCLKQSQGSQTGDQGSAQIFDLYLHTKLKVTASLEAWSLTSNLGESNVLRN